MIKFLLKASIGSALKSCLECTQPFGRKSNSCLCLLLGNLNHVVYYKEATATLAVSKPGKLILTTVQLSCFVVIAS